jgi:hypothetical protein
MADQWFYAVNGQQLGPVSFTELQTYIANGQLRASDLVWTAGMAQWAAASKVQGLAPACVSRAEPLIAVEPLPARGQPYERGAPEEDDWEEERPRRRPAARGMSTAAKVAIGLGAAVAVLFVIGIVVVIVIFANKSSNPASPTTFHLKKGEMRSFRITFPAGKKAEIWVRSDHNTDVDLFVCMDKVRDDQVDKNFLHKDDGMQKDCYVTWIPANTQTYKVVVWNRVHIPPAPHIEGPNRVTMSFSPQTP